MNEWQKILEASPNRVVRAGYRELCRFGQTPAAVRSTFFAAAPVYLATPYLERVIRRGRFSIDRSLEAIDAAQRESLRLTQEGFTVLSPVAILAPLLHLAKDPGEDLRLPDPRDRHSFRQWRDPLIDACRVVVVPDLPGSIVCLDIRETVVRAISRNKQVYFYAA